MQIQTLTEKQSQLIDISREILNNLKAEQLSLDEIEKLLNQRGQVIAEIDPLTENVNAATLPVEYQDQLSEGFRTYRELHNLIQPELDRIMSGQEVALDDASKRRKAEDRYLVLETPDISYISES